jgi:hypothetical protein
MNMKIVKLLLCAGVVALGACTAQPTLQTGPDAEVTFDGLTKVDRTIMDAVWVREDIDLTGYDKVLLVGAGIEYRPTRGPQSGSTRTTAVPSTRNEFSLSEDQKARVRETVGQAFLDELSKSEVFEIVDQPGPDVLSVKGGLLDVVSNVPPESLGRGNIYLSQVGEATLVLELRDSQTDAILLRAVDRRAAEPMTAMPMSSVTNAAEVRRLANRWARLLRNGLEQAINPPEGGILAR